MKKSIDNKSMLTRLIITISIISGIATMLSSCQKYLDAKPNQSLTTPTTIDDLEGIMNNYNFINARYPSAGEVASDNYYLYTADFNSLPERQRMFYTWQKYDDIGGDYTGLYATIEYVNVVIDYLPKISGAVQAEKDNVLGNALFVRGTSHFALAQLFAKPFIGASASNDLGIVLRLTSDITVKPVRSTIVQTYSSILADLKQAVSLLPEQPMVKYRASKPAAYGMIARVYLSMNDYENAGHYADSALNLYNTLIDYNTVSTSAAIPFAQFNDEVIYDARSIPSPALLLSKARVDTNLYASYATTDLRRSIYFNANNTGVFFKSNYTGQYGLELFTGIATDELFLTKAEVQARAGDINGSLTTLNALLINRYQAGSFAPYATSDRAQLLKTILKERWKELILRGLRWMDLRRLNQDTQFAITLYRDVDSTSYQLPPGSPRYVFEIDQNAVNISGTPQNP